MFRPEHYFLNDLEIVSAQNIDLYCEKCSYKIDTSPMARFRGKLSMKHLAYCWCSIIYHSRCKQHYASSLTFSRNNDSRGRRPFSHTHSSPQDLPRVTRSHSLSFSLLTHFLVPLQFHPGKTQVIYLVW